MLYVTTRNDRETFTSYKTLLSNMGPDNGQFLPFSMPMFSSNDLAQLSDKSFGQTVADVINRFFSARLSGSDVDFTIGRNTARIVSMNHKIVFCELWRNPMGKFSFVVDSLYRKVLGEKGQAIPTTWFQIVVRTAVLFACYGELLKKEILDKGQKFDISASTIDFSAVVSAWYARCMGLPIGRIICTTDDTCSLWDFVYRGSFLPNRCDADVLSGLETMIYGTLGLEESKRFSQACEEKRQFTIDNEQLLLFNDGLLCSVTSPSRTETTINSVFRSNGYIIGSKSAFCYAGIQDYRAKSGESRITLIFAETNPVDDADIVASATGMDKHKLFEHIQTT